MAHHATPVNTCRENGGLAFSAPLGLLRAPAKNNFSHNGTATARRDGGGEFYVDGVALQFCQRKWQQLENLSSIKSKYKPVKRITEEAFLGKWQNYARARILSTFQAFLASSNGGRESALKGPSLYVLVFYLILATQLNQTHRLPPDPLQSVQG